MFRRSLITFAFVLGGLFGTTTVSHTIQSRDLAGLRTSTREKANDVSTSSDLLRATAAVTPEKVQAAAHPSWSVRSGQAVVKSSDPTPSGQTKVSQPSTVSAPATNQTGSSTSSAASASNASAGTATAGTSTAQFTVAAAPAKTASAVTNQSATQPTAQPQAQPAKPAAAYASRVLMFAGVTVPYIIGNESMDAAPMNGAATWGGQANYSNVSGQNTHFIGHNPGAFAAMLSLGIGSPITVTDAAGSPRTYHVYRLVQVSPEAVTADGQDLWNEITGTGGGQRITLQTCVGDYWRLIAFAR